MSDNEEIPVDDLVTVSCPLFRQLLNAYSEDAATDDYIYYLGEALRQASLFHLKFYRETRMVADLGCVAFMPLTHVFLQRSLLTKDASNIFPLPIA